jgi:translation initiation factor 3 subunit B
MFDDFDKYSRVPDSYQQPDAKPFQPAENLNSWMLDKLGRDQFVLRSGSMTEVFWNDGKRNRSDPVSGASFVGVVD